MGLVPGSDPVTAVEYTTLGDTGIEVSRICFGSWQYGGQWGNVEVQQAKDAVRRARELGINFFDTAQAYGFGKSEKLLGEALREDLDGNRDGIVLATKGGLRPTETGGVVRDSSREWLRQGLEESLDFLGVDHVDLYQVHWPDFETPFEDVAETLAEFEDEGLVRAAGVSNYDVDHMTAFRRGGRLDALQPPYHMLRRDVEASILPYCRRHDVGVLAYGALAHGLLTGKYGPDAAFPDDDWRSRSPWFSGHVLETNARVVDRLAEVAEQAGTDLKQLAVAWVLDHPAVDAAIVGARKPEHVEGVAPAAELELSQGTLAQVEAVLEDAVPIGGATPETV